MSDNEWLSQIHPAGTPDHEYWNQTSNKALTNGISDALGPSSFGSIWTAYIYHTVYYTIWLIVMVCLLHVS
jgi:hypothetical protein